VALRDAWTRDECRAAHPAGAALAETWNSGALINAVGSVAVSLAAAYVGWTSGDAVP
jgi:hypothetical protein